MPLEMRKIFSLILLTLIMGCSEAQLYDPPVTEPPTRIFDESYERTWRAIQISLQRYPVTISNYESGIIETKMLKGGQVFTDPNEKKLKPGYRYKLTIRAVKGQFEGKPAVKVTIYKGGEIQPDFFSGYQSVPSDGLEERAVLYRIGRVLDIDRILEKPTKSK